MINTIQINKTLQVINSHLMILHILQFLLPHIDQFLQLCIPKPRRGQRPCHPRIIPDNTHGNHPPVEIERDLQQGGDHKPANEKDLGDLYSVKFFNHILASTAPAFNIPKQYKDVAKLTADEQHQWRTAMQEEMDSLQDRKVWDLVDLPPGRTPIKGRWVYVVKSDGQHKAHFVAKGFTQIYRIDFEETFSPVARFKSV